MGWKDAALSFIGGLVMTLVLVMVVPVVVDVVVGQYLADIIGDREFLTLSSDVIVNLVMWVVIIGFMVLLGAGGILKRFGAVGVLGLVFAYWLLGDVTDAIVPVITLVIVLAIGWAIRRRRGEKGKPTKK